MERHAETARALEIIVSRLKFDRETARILMAHLSTQRELAAQAAKNNGEAS